MDRERPPGDNGRHRAASRNRHEAVPEDASSRKRAQTGTVSVEVKTVLPTSDRTFEVDWVETARDLFGGVKSTDHWKGSFMIALNSPTEERQARINPLGLYVTAASWAKVL